MVKLDYTIESPEERKKIVEEILKENPNPNEKYLEILSDYLVLCMEKEEKRTKKLLTENRLVTINKRETSFEGLVSQLENGEDGIYNMITNDKNVIFSPKVSITPRDIEEVPGLKQLREAIEYWEQKLKTASGKNAYIIKKTIIDLRKDQYILKNDYYKPITLSKNFKGNNYIELNENIKMVNQEPVATGVSFLNPDVVSEFLCAYSKLKQDSWDAFQGDMWYAIYDLENLIDKALKNYPLYKSLLEYKIDGKTNLEIQELLFNEYGVKHSLEYISSLWRNKIPKLIATQAQEDYIIWYYTEKERGKWKRCSRCGQIKLAHNRFFSKNKTSKDGFYSICKSCRNSKGKEKK